MEDLLTAQTEIECSTEILQEMDLVFEDNLIAEGPDGCSDYGCTCIAYEKCCGCIFQ